MTQFAWHTFPIFCSLPMSQSVGTKSRTHWEKSMMVRSTLQFQGSPVRLIFLLQSLTIWLILPGMGIQNSPQTQYEYKRCYQATGESLSQSGQNPWRALVRLAASNSPFPLFVGATPRTKRRGGNFVQFPFVQLRLKMKMIAQAAENYHPATFLNFVLFNLRLIVLE